MKRHKGFTLIELLVVIAVIALLMAILFPALAAAKKQAMAMVCMGNQRNLIVGFLAYLSDNEDKVPCSNTFPPDAQDFNPLAEFAWAKWPQDESGAYLGDAWLEITDDERFRGIKKGVIYPYVQDIKAYHCPGDRRYKVGTRVGGSRAFTMYRSYGMQGGLNGEEWRWSHKAIMRLTELKAPKKPSNVYVFVEEYYDGAGCNYNGGSWCLGYNGLGESCWWNAMAVRHVDSGTLSFADGNVIRKKWRDEDTMAFAEERPANKAQWTQPDNPDLAYLIEGYAVPLPREARYGDYPDFLSRY